MFKLKQKKLITKKDKEEAILLGLTELFIKTNKPISSGALKEYGFDSLSSATIRNYFSKLEKLGYLKQLHSSGGREPTSAAYKNYANYHLSSSNISSKDETFLQKNLKCKCKQLTSYLHNAAEILSFLCNGCVFLISPRFEQDFIQKIKLIYLSDDQLLCVIITDLGQIKTEVLNTEKQVKEKDLSQIEQFILWRLNKATKPSLPEKATKLAQKFYNEIMLRHVANFSSDKKTEEIYKTGLSNLLTYPELQDPSVLADNLSLFENTDKIKTFLTESMKINKLSYWIGDDLASMEGTIDSTIITIPYKVNQIPVGAIALLLPQRTNYPKIFGIIQVFAEYVSQTLTKSMYKFKINYQSSKTNNDKTETFIMLENKTKNKNSGEF